MFLYNGTVFFTVPGRQRVRVITREKKIRNAGQTFRMTVYIMLVDTRQGHAGVYNGATINRGRGVALPQRK